ncbi:MAG: hypothetical protein ACOYXT_13720 [Bacteroidota bacterium]
MPQIEQVAEYLLDKTSLCSIIRKYYTSFYDLRCDQRRKELATQADYGS